MKGKIQRIGGAILGTKLDFFEREKITLARLLNYSNTDLVSSTLKYEFYV